MRRSSRPVDGSWAGRPVVLVAEFDHRVPPVVNLAAAVGAEADMQTTCRRPLGGCFRSRSRPTRRILHPDWLRAVEELERASVEVAGGFEVWQTDPDVVDHSTRLPRLDPRLVRATAERATRGVRNFTLPWDVAIDLRRGAQTRVVLRFAWFARRYRSCANPTSGFCLATSSMRKEHCHRPCRPVRRRTCKTLSL